MTKTKKGILIALAAVLVIAIGCGAYFLFGNSAGAANPEDGEIYRTKTESFWVGVGKASMSFQHIDVPEDKAADGQALYGDVCLITASSS